MDNILDVTEFVTYDDFLLLIDNLGIIILKLSELVTLVHIILVVALCIVITLVIYNVFIKFFY